MKRRCEHGTLRGCLHCDWLAKIENLRPGDACEFRGADPGWQPGTVLVNGGGHYWRVRATDGRECSMHIEAIRLPGQEEAWC